MQVSLHQPAPSKLSGVAEAINDEMLVDAALDMFLVDGGGASKDSTSTPNVVITSVVGVAKGPMNHLVSLSPSGAERSVGKIRIVFARMDVCRKHCNDLRYAFTHATSWLVVVGCSPMFAFVAAASHKVPSVRPRYHRIGVVCFPRLVHFYRVVAFCFERFVCSIRHY